MTAVRACPFCGHDEAHHDEALYAAYLECGHCGATGPRVANVTISYRANVEEAWNTRRKPIGATPSGTQRSAAKKEGQP